ncbi:MAG: hypothetical protein SF028_12465 [Candidatus Sumerlaeia bacterium]|nr:hypothetical protein [Candidatus Sumerlaeia bacterium]
MRRIARAAAALLAAATLAACGGRAAFVSPYETGPPTAQSVGELRATLSERASQHPKLWVRADLVLESDLRKGRDAVTATALFEEPDRFRLLGSREVVGTLFDVLLLGDNASLYFAREGLRFDGTAEELRGKLGAAGSVMPRDLIEAVTVTQRLLATMEKPAGEWSAIDRRDHWLVATYDDLGRQSIYRVRKADGLVDEWLLRSADGVERLRIAYGEYRLVDVRGRKEPFPWRFEARVPEGNAKVRASVDGYKIDPPFVPKSFQPRQTDEVYALRDLAFEE